MKYNLLFIIFACVLLWFSENAFVSVKNERHCADVYKKANAVLYDLVDAEASQRGFIITGRENYLEPYNISMAKLDSDLSELDNISTGDGLRNIEKFSPLMTKELGDTIQIRRSQGLDAAIKLVNNNTGNDLMTGIRASINKIIDESAGENQEYVNKLADEVSIIRICVMLLLVLSLLNNGIIIWNKYKKPAPLQIT